MSTVLFIAGFHATVYTDEIKNAWPINVLPERPWSFSFPALIFWMSAIIPTVVLTFRHRAADRSRQLAEAKLDDRADQLEQLIRTMPPRDFLSAVSEMFRSADKLVDAILGVPKTPQNPDAIDQSVREILKMVALLAAKFSGHRPGRHRYAANIMLFRSLEDLKGNLSEVETRLKFMVSGATVDGLRGILDVIQSLSATAETNSSEADHELEPFALPVPKEIKRRDKTTVLPGAPYAFVEGQASVFFDTSEVYRWCKDYADFTEDVESSVKEFFENDNRVNAFISIPLKERVTGFPFAVLNIHSDVEKGFLHTDGHSVSQFNNLILPFCDALVKLLSVRSEPQK